MSAQVFLEDEDSDKKDGGTRLGRFFADRNAAIDSEGPDLFGEGPSRGQTGREPKRGRAIAFLLTLIALVSFAALLWYAYTWAQGPVDPANLPVVAAEEGPIKVKPEDEGGMEVPHQDKLIFDPDASGETGAQVEHLLPPPESPQVVELAPAPAAEVPEPEAETAESVGAPVETPVETASEPVAVPAPDTAQAEADDTIAGLIDTAGDQSQPSEAVSEPAVSAEAPAADVTPEPEAPKAEAPKDEAPKAEPAKPQPKPEPPAAPAQQAATPAASGAFFVQLAAVRSAARAEQEWQRLAKAHSDLLGSLSLRVEQIESQGSTYHRVQGGPLASRGAADALCQKLKAANQPCLVKKIR